MSDSLLSVPQLAKQLNLPVKTIYYYVGRQEIPYLKIGKHLRFELPKVIEWFQHRTNELRPACFNGPSLVEDLSARSLKIGRKAS